MSSIEGEEGLGMRLPHALALKLGMLAHPTNTSIKKMC